VNQFVRWYLKKVARRAVIAAGSCRSSGNRKQVRALTYHRCGEAAYDPFCVSQRDFEAQMQWLADNGLAVSLADLEEFMAGERDLTAGAVLVTVDDGLRSLYTEMLPVLRQFDIPAVAYVTPSLIDDEAGRPRSYLTWDELHRLAASGVAIGSHGWTHRSLGEMGPEEVRDEALRSRETIEQRLGIRVTSFAYPYGTRADFSNLTANVLAEGGYTTAFTSQHGSIVPGCDPIELPRIKVEGGEGLWMFRRLCRGAIDAWRLVDRTLWRAQHCGK